jgi:hypothetical protein
VGIRSTHARRMWLVDTVAAKLVRSIQTRSDRDPMLVVSLAA